MKIEKLTDNKFKIIINTIDINKFNIQKKYINFDLLIKNKENTSNLISNILSNVQNTIDFKSSDCKLFIEISSFENEFLVLIITKIIENSNVSCKPFSFGFLYKFNTFNDFLDFCNSLNISRQEKIIPKYIILYEYNSYYYLYISEFSYKKYRLFCNYLLEFASFINSNDLINNKIIEYGNIILKNTSFSDYIKYLDNN